MRVDMGDLAAGYTFLIYLLLTGCLNIADASRWHHSHFKVKHKMGKMKVKATPEGANFEFGGDDLKVDMHPAHTWVRPIHKFYHADYHLGVAHFHHDDEEDYLPHGHYHDEIPEEEHYGHSGDHHWHHYHHFDNDGEEEGGYDNFHHDPHYWHDSHPWHTHRGLSNYNGGFYGGHHLLNNYGHPVGGYNRGDVPQNEHWGHEDNEDNGNSEHGNPEANEEEMGEDRDKVVSHKTVNMTLDSQKNRTETGQSRDKTVIAEKLLGKSPEERAYGKHIYPDDNAFQGKSKKPLNPQIPSSSSGIAPDLRHYAEKPDEGSAEHPGSRGTISPFDDENDDGKQEGDKHMYGEKVEDKDGNSLNLVHMPGDPNFDVHVDGDKGDLHYGHKPTPADVDARIDNGGKPHIDTEDRPYGNGFSPESHEHEGNDWGIEGNPGRSTGLDAHIDNGGKPNIDADDHPSNNEAHDQEPEEVAEGHIENFANATISNDESNERGNTNEEHEFENSYRRSSQPSSDAENAHQDDAPLIVHPNGDPRVRQLKKAFFERNPSTEATKHVARLQFSVRNRIPRRSRISKRITIKLPNFKKEATAKWNGAKSAFSKFLRTLKTVW